MILLRRRKKRTVSIRGHQVPLDPKECPWKISFYPLQWWASLAMRYPHLSQLATKYLAPPATSLPSEQAFIAAVNIVNIKRLCLLPVNVNMLVFLAANLQ